MAAAVSPSTSIPSRAGHRADRPSHSHSRTLVASPTTTLIHPFRDNAPSGGTSYSRHDLFQPPSQSRPIKASMVKKPQPPTLDTSVSNATTRLHKRVGSASSSQGPSSPLSACLSNFNAPFTAYDESASPSTPLSGTPKLKPYLRKMSVSKETKEDQGRIDLSKSVVDNERLSGLGIQDSLPRSASDVNFTYAARRGSAHNMKISAGSQGSNLPASQLRSNQPFVHPMRQTPRPYAPTIPSSSAVSTKDDDDVADESDDVVLDDELRLPPGFRNKRSMSLSSTAQNAPTPLSQSYTAADLCAADTLANMPSLSSQSQSNLSTRSGHSSRSSNNLRPGRPRRDTERSTDASTLPSSRTSLDKAVSFVSRSGKADSSSATREERIRAARRKFEEKEAEKDRKMHNKKSGRQRRRSEASERKTVVHSPKEKPPKTTQRSGDTQPQLHAMSYEETPPTDLAGLPQHGAEAGMSEKPAKNRSARSRQKKNAQGNWLRFSTWFSTRMMNCGNVRRTASDMA